MAKSLNFHKIKKPYFTVTLPDENSTTLMIRTPTKAIMDEFLSTQDSLNDVEMDTDASDALYELCTKIINHNKGGIKIAQKDLENLLDFTDLVIFFRSYANFISGIVNEKN